MFISEPEMLGYASHMPPFPASFWPFLFLFLFHSFFFFFLEIIDSSVLVLAYGLLLFVSRLFCDIFLNDFQLEVIGEGGPPDGHGDDDHWFFGFQASPPGIKLVKWDGFHYTVASSSFFGSLFGSLLSIRLPFSIQHYFGLVFLF